MKTDYVMLHSSGIDSFLLDIYCKRFLKNKTISHVYFDYKGRYTEVEKSIILFLNSIDSKHQIVIDESLNLSDLERPDAYIENRNLLMIMQASAKYSDKVLIGGTKSDRVDDNNESTSDLFSETLSKIHGRKIQILSPFYDEYKEDIVLKYFHNGFFKIDDILHKTFSCYQPSPISSRQIVVDNVNHRNRYVHITNECHSCSACFRKNVILFSLDIPIKFYNETILEKYRNEIISKIGISNFECGNLTDLDSRFKYTARYIRWLQNQKK